MRTKRALYNSVTMLLYEVVAVVSAFILPRLILSFYGSEYNGVIASITQFIGYIAVFTGGLGAVTRAALYKPLAERDRRKISEIIRATEIFMRKVAFIFAGCLFCFAALYPLMIKEDFGWFFTFSLSLILGIGTITGYFFGAAYNNLIVADQRGYILMIVRICSVLVSTATAAFVIVAGGEIRLAQLAIAISFAANPIFIFWYARRHYKIIRPIEPDNVAIKQKWDAFAHQVASYLHQNAAIAVLTVFSGVKEVSVYAIYYMVIRAINTIMLGLAGTGVTAAFGDMLAKNEKETLKQNLRIYEFVANSLSVIFCTCAALLLVQFVMVYTAGIIDADYNRPLFAYIACFSQFIFIFRMPYQELVNAAGHFKQTRNGAILEACINIAFTIIFVQWLGLTGAALGTLCAVIFRTAQYTIYTSRHIVKRSLWTAAKKLFISMLNAGAVVAVSIFLPGMGDISYIGWILYALPVFGVTVGMTALFAFVFYREESRMLIGKLKGLARRRA